MNWRDYIITDEKILRGKPIIKGTRLSVEFILGLLSEGWTEEEILENYPQLSREALRAVFQYLKEYASDEILLPL